MDSVPDRFNFPEQEKAILQLWKEKKAFQKSLDLSKSRPRFSFYDGPPFATGLPHYGHILAGTIKDTVTRWASMDGYYVERRFGWDCHGLPVEYEIDKKLGIKGPEDVKKMGIKAYNTECRKIVMRYSQEWEDIVTRLGRWIDFKNDYKTMYPWFMESIWWVFKQLFEKGLVYRGFKVMPFSTGCNTPLSNFESGQNYKDVNDPAVIVSFPILTDREKGTSLLAWTTTPWTLPSNLSLCVNPSENYVKVQDVKRERMFILMEKRLIALYADPGEYTVVKMYKGSELAGLEYEPLFSYFEKRRATGAFRVLNDNYVTDSSGTGVVHQAPYFGEDDYRVCLANGVITRDGDIVCPVDESGRFDSSVTDYAGQYVKDADKHIIKDLKVRGRMVDDRQCRHNYPFCWRSETPLIYKAVPSWFVRVETLVDKLLANNSSTYWVPDFVKEKRFANWLRDARDWAISRNRYWGTPIPLWVSDDGEEVVCVGSIEELAQLSGVKLDDIHREFVDEVTIPSKMGKGSLKRVPEVFDCWFESGSMPYAQQHYPFEHKKEFEDSFPADFIAEGIDQTRGWFYTLLVLSTALFGKPPFKNLICNGLILASDGQKMSKRKKNYPDPTIVVDLYGADALRLYLINSPAVRGDQLKFKEEGVKDILKDAFLPWFNAYRFLIQNVERLQREESISFKHNEKNWVVSTNYMDRWILSFTQSLMKFVRTEMTEYRLYTVVPRLIKFVDNLTNWYVRMNRKRLKGDTGIGDCKAAVETLFVVIFSMVKTMAPFTPFLAENFYQNLSHLIDGEKREDSVHFLSLPHAREDLIDTTIETAVSRMQSVIELARVIRDQQTLPVKYPLKQIVVVQENEECLRDVELLRDYILEELNIRTLLTTNDRSSYNVKMEAKADQKTLGLRLKGAFKPVAAALEKLTDAEVTQMQEKGFVEVEGHKIDASDIRVKYVPDGTKGGNFHAKSDWQALVLIDCTKDENSESEGLAREVINRVQKLRKEAGLQPNDDISIYYETSSALAKIIEAQREFIFSTVKQPVVGRKPPSSDSVLISRSSKVKDSDLKLTLTARGDTKAAPTKNTSQSAVDLQLQYCNLYCNDQASTAVLENPLGSGNIITFGCLSRLAQDIYSLKQTPVLYCDGDRLTSSSCMASLKGKSVTVGQSVIPAESGSSACPIVYATDGCSVMAIVTENPIGQRKLNQSGILNEVQAVLGCSKEKVQVGESLKTLTRS